MVNYDLGWWLTYPSEIYESQIPYIMENKKCLKPPTSYKDLVQANIL